MHFRCCWQCFSPDGTHANRHLSYDASSWKRPPFFEPDGLKVDREGNVFAARPDGLDVIAPDGTLIGRIETGAPTSNCAWGDDSSTLYITGGSGVYRLRTRGAGF